MAREVGWHLTDIRTNYNPRCACAPGVNNYALGMFFLSTSHIYEIQNCTFSQFSSVCETRNG